MFTCEYCSSSFKSSKSFKKHQDKALYCKNYRDVSFLCRKCDLVCNDIRVFNEHVEKCEGKKKPIVDESLTSKVLALEGKKDFLQHKCKDLELELGRLEKEGNKLRLELRMEKFKSNLFSQIVTAQTGMKIADFYEEKSDGIHIYNYENGTVPVIVHEYAKEHKDQVTSVKKKYNIIASKKKRGKTGKIYRSVRNRVELVEEKPEEMEEKIKKVEETFEEIVHENFDVSMKETVGELEQQFNELQQSRNYKKYLLNIKELRGKLLGKLELSKYIKMIKTHIKKLEEIFLKKKHDQHKRKNNISTALSPLDQRLVFYNRYYDTILEPDHIQLLKLSIKVNMSHNYPKRYVPFRHTDLYDKLYNYSIAVFPVRETIKRVLVNPFGFSNVAYLDLNKSKADDPHSFYTLEKVESNGIRCWKLECRLDDFSKNLAMHMKTYCIELFRKIYLDTFHDNHYREDYQSKAPIAQQDCEQLLMNILALSKSKTFCDLLRHLIVKHCTIKPTELDKFNLTTDDNLHKRQFARENDADEDLTATVKRLFDEISNEDAQQVWSERIS